MKLPNKENVIITHYGCPKFESEIHTVFWIGAIYFENSKKKYLFLTGDEIDIIIEYFSFLRKNKHKQILHWSMNSPKYGFMALRCRYEELTSQIIDINFIDDFDLSEFFKEKYGINYIERKGGRLNNLATLNDFSGISNKIEVSSKNEAVNRLELLFSIYQADQQGVLKVLSKTDVTHIGDTVKPQQKDLSNEENSFTTQNNDFILSTIEDYLDPIKDYFNIEGYNLLVNELGNYFNTGAFTKSTDIIKVVNKPNKKLIGSTLKTIFHNCFNDNRKLSIEYLRFGKQRISIFNSVSFDESNYLRSNLYKYYHSKP